jgi:peptidyl-prolyl cis-trans isomerase B (cyclophilin B)
VASSKRERELARQRAARQAARRTEKERRRKQRNAIVASVLAVLLVAGAVAATALTGDDGPDELAADPTPSASAEATSDPSAEPTEEPAADPTEAVTAGECTYVPAGEPARPVEPPPSDVEQEQPFTATLQTSQGDIPFELFTADAPCTVHSFRHLAETGFYDDTPCHRLTDQGIFVLQCGDPTGTGRGGPGYSFADENLEGAMYPRGTVAMANSGPDTNGSQFFLVYRDTELPPSYTPFGQISEAGLAVLDQIAAAGAAPPDQNGNTAPNTPVQIVDVVVEPAG